MHQHPRTIVIARVRSVAKHSDDSEPRSSWNRRKQQDGKRCCAPTGNAGECAATPSLREQTPFWQAAPNEGSGSQT